MQHRRLSASGCQAESGKARGSCRHDACLSARADAGESAYICSRAPIYPGQRSIVGCIIRYEHHNSSPRSCWANWSGLLESGDSRALVDLRRVSAPGPTRKTTLRGLRTRLHASVNCGIALSRRSHLPFLKPSRTITSHAHVTAAVHMPLY
jgi:hypothetical protein